MDFGSFEIGIIISDVVMFADVNVGCVPRLTAVLKAGSTDPVSYTHLASRRIVMMNLFIFQMCYYDQTWGRLGVS